MHRSDLTLLSWCFSFPTRSLYFLFFSQSFFFAFTPWSFLQKRPGFWGKGQIYLRIREGGIFLSVSSKSLSESTYFPGSWKTPPAVGCSSQQADEQTPKNRPNPYLALYTRTQAGVAKTRVWKASPGQSDRGAGEVKSSLCRQGSVWAGRKLSVQINSLCKYCKLLCA